MARMRWIQIDGELIPADEVTYRESNAPIIMGDIQPYQSMIDGSIIESRSSHREHLKRHGMIEVGNETKYLTQKRPLQAPDGLKRTIAEVANCLLKEK